MNPILVPALAGLLALVVAWGARAADFIGLPRTTMREVVQWGLEVGVPAAAWSRIDAAYDAHAGRLDDLDGREGSLSSLGETLRQRGADLPACEREMVRRTDLFLTEEDRLSADLRQALGASPEGVDSTLVVVQPDVDGALALWTARRMLGLSDAAQSLRIYYGVRHPLPDVESLRDRLGLSAEEVRAARQALTLHLPALAEKARAFVRARSRVLAEEQYSELVGPHAAREAMTAAIEAGRSARLALLRAQQDARRAVAEALTPDHREEAARMLLAQVAPGTRYTRVGTISETIVPYLHDLDDRTQRKLSQKIKQLRAELAAAERRTAAELEEAIERGSFDLVIQAGEGFEQALDDIADREGPGMSTLIGPRCVNDLATLEMGYSPDAARKVLARLMPASRIEDFLRELAAKDPAAAAQFGTEDRTAPAPKGSLADAPPPGPEMMAGLLAALAPAPGTVVNPVAKDDGTVRSGLEAAFREHALRWRERVVPAQVRLRETISGDPSAVGQPLVSLSLRMEPDGTLVVTEPLDYVAALRAVTELDRIIGEVDGALFEAIDALVGPQAPNAALVARLDRAFEIYVQRSVESFARAPAPTARPVDCVDLLESGELDRSEQDAALAVAAVELADYARALRERSAHLHQAALLQRAEWEREPMSDVGSLGFLGGPGSVGGPRRPSAEILAARAAAEDCWRLALGRVMAVWGQTLVPEQMERLRGEALRRAYPTLAARLRPLEALFDECETLVSEGDPRRPLVDGLVRGYGERGWRRFESAARAAESTAPTSAGLCELASGAGPAHATSDGKALVRDLDDLSVRAMRDLWIVTGDDRMLKRLGTH